MWQSYIKTLGAIPVWCLTRASLVELQRSKGVTGGQNGQQEKQPRETLLHLVFVFAMNSNSLSAYRKCHPI